MEVVISIYNGSRTPPGFAYLLVSDIAIPFVSRGERGWVFTVAIQMRELNPGDKGPVVPTA